MDDETRRFAAIPGSVGVRESLYPKRLLGEMATRRIRAKVDSSLPRSPLATACGRHFVNALAENREMPFPSSGVASCGRRSTPIRKKVIGHRMSLLMWNVAGARGLRFPRRLLAALHQPARQHGASVFLEPLVQQSADFFAQIGRVAETRELVALQRIARSREKKFPGRLRLGTRHVGLLETDAWKIAEK
jgi:hypothetical protein